MQGEGRGEEEMRGEEQALIAYKLLAFCSMYDKNQERQKLEQKL